MKQKNVQARIKKLIEVDGLTFKDLNGNGVLDPYEDWRLTPEERAKDLVSRMTMEEKAGMFVIGDIPMGISSKPEEPTSHGGVLHEKDVEVEMRGHKRRTMPTTYQLTTRHQRHIIVRENASPEDMARWVNTLEEVCEGTRLGIPCIVASNSKNESADVRYNAEEEPNKFTTFPGTLGLAASRDMGMIEKFAKIVHDEFMATNIRKGYMYMADTATDPRWFRTFGTFGENPDLICDIFPRVIKGVQGEKLDENSVAMTTKHFPGGGAVKTALTRTIKRASSTAMLPPAAWKSIIFRRLRPRLMPVHPPLCRIMPSRRMRSRDSRRTASIILMKKLHLLTINSLLLGSCAASWALRVMLTPTPA